MNSLVQDGFNGINVIQCCFQKRVKLARESTVIWVILGVSDVRHSWRNFVTYSRIHCKMHFHALWIPWHCSRTHAKTWRWSVGVLGGGRWGGGCRFGAGGGRWVGVAVRLVCCLWCVDVLLCILTKCFSELDCFAFSSRLFSLLSSPARWVLPASLLASLASPRFLSVWFALHRRAEVFGPVFWSVFPHRGNVFLQS